MGDAVDLVIATSRGSPRGTGSGGARSADDAHESISDHAYQLASYQSENTEPLLSKVQIIAAFGPLKVNLPPAAFLTADAGRGASVGERRPESTSDMPRGEGSPISFPVAALSPAPC